MTIPTGSPPPEMLPKALSYLAMEVGKAAPLGPSGVLAPLSAFLSLLARHRTSAPLGPLHAFSALCSESPDSVSLELACDALLSYPSAVCVLDPAISHLKLDWDGLLAALPSHVGAPGGVRAVRLAHSLLRLRSTENAVVKHSQALVRALAKAYPGADTRTKGEMLVLARALAGKDHELRRLLENEGPRGVPLLNQSMGRDYSDLFESHRALGDAEAAATRGAHDEEHGTDPVRIPHYNSCGVWDGKANDQRLANLTALFPHIPAHLLSDALAHPQFSAAGANTDDAAAPLIDAILGNELPKELAALKAAASSDGPAAAASPVAPTVEPVPEPSAAPPRRSQFTDADLAKIRIKDSCVLPISFERIRSWGLFGQKLTGQRDSSRPRPRPRDPEPAPRLHPPPRPGAGGGGGGGRARHRRGARVRLRRGGVPARDRDAGRGRDHRPRRGGGRSGQ